MGEYRDASISDAQAIAHLHAVNWRRTYRGLFSDRFLDGDLEADRLAAWQDHLVQPGTLTRLYSVHGELAAVAYCVGAQHPKWGTLVEHLHVGHQYQRTGIGRALLSQAAVWALGHYPGHGMHLEVVVGNTGARAFYDALGGQEVELFSERFDPWATGQSHRMAWESPRLLIQP